MIKVSLGVGAVALAATSGLVALVALGACASVSDASAFSGTEDAGFGADGGASEAGFPSADGGSVGLVEANAIVLVHAASFPAFRVCFEGAPKNLPQPSVDLMPESNVVGVDVGTAVRLPARGETLGRAFVFLESKLRPFYPGGIAGPTCEQVLSSAGTKGLAIEAGAVTADVSRGVHALVLGGCQGQSVDPNASVEECGTDWEPLNGNLRITTLTLMAYARLGNQRLPIQLVQLSPALQRRADGRALGIGFGALGALGALAALPDGGTPDLLLEGPVPFAKAVPDPPAVLDYASTDTSSYATSGVFVTLGGALDDAGAPVSADGGAREVVISQSLADIQKRSSPRSLPADWFSVASSYVVLSVGDTDPRLLDGGHDDNPRRALHLLAIPLATPDAGVAGDAGP